MKKYTVVFLMLLVSLVFCNTSRAQDVGVLIAPLVKEGVKMLGEAIIEKATAPKPEEYQVGKYVVKLTNGYYKNDKNEPCVHLTTYEDSEKIIGQRLAYINSRPAEKQKVDDFRTMSKAERKEYLKETYDKFFNIKLDFGPEPAVAETSPEKSPSVSRSSEPSGPMPKIPSSSFSFR